MCLTLKEAMFIISNKESFANFAVQKAQQRIDKIEEDERR